MMLGTVGVLLTLVSLLAGLIPILRPLLPGAGPNLSAKEKICLIQFLDRLFCSSSKVPFA